MRRLFLFAAGAAAPVFAAPLHNVAPSALVVAYNTPKAGFSNVSWDNPEHPAAGAADGVISGWPENPKAEWGTKGLTVGAELCLVWSKPVRLAEVRLHDRPNPDDNVTAGVLVTDSGKTYPVGALANTGKLATVVKLDGSPVKSLTFRVTGVSPTTKNAGLSEIGCYTTDPTPETLEQILPKPVYDGNPGFLKLYDLAWKQARDHIRLSPGLPVPLYMDEACWDNTIWIWDTCFMAMYCRYAPAMFPGIRSLDNFYELIHDGAKSSLRVQMVDNPPLFAWAEYDSFRMTGDKTRLKRVVEDKAYLQKHYALLDGLKERKPYANFARGPNDWIATDGGFRWSPGHSGMDNTPRGRGAKNGALWVDALAQQGLSALYISKLAGELGDTGAAKKWRATYDAVRDAVNAKYWDSKDGFYYDIDRKTGAFSRVATPASYWPMLAGMCTKEQAAAMAAKATDPAWFGGERPWPSLVPTDPGYNVANNRHGDYWRGGVWLPMAYLGVKALDNYGYRKEAREASVKVLGQMLRTYENFSPHTIWECYSPVADRPSTEHGSPTSRPDFCGWSALGPISLFIEDIIGIHDVDAEKRTVSWRLVSPERCGLRNFRFGDIITDLVAEKDGTLNVKSTGAYTLDVNGDRLDVKPGDNTFRVRRER